MATTSSESRMPGTLLRVSLWIAQILLFFVFGSAGLAKLLMTIPELSAVMPWTGQYPQVFVRTIALIDLAGGLGVLLPAVTRIKPGLTVLAALGCALLQVCAIVFHISRGEAILTPANAVLLALALFIFWGRGRRVPIAARG